MAEGSLAPARLHESATSCEQTGVGTFDTRDGLIWPAVAYMSGEPRYGMLSADANAGMRMPQSRKLSLDAYNSGCLNPHGCVNTEGFKCTGPVASMGEELTELFTELNKSAAPAGFEYNPPSYMMGIKMDTVNSVTGWAVGADGQMAWKSSKQATPMPCSNGLASR